MVDAAIPYNPVEDRQNFPLDGLPKSALQAIYHEVTGKTESLTKHINGNVVINSADIDRLYHMIIDQLEHFTVVFQPTVTVKVKCYNSKSITYSSWERYYVESQ